LKVDWAKWKDDDDAENEHQPAAEDDLSLGEMDDVMGGMEGLNDDKFGDDDNDKDETDLPPL